MIIVRDANADDLDIIRHIHISAFPKAEAHSVAALAAGLLKEKSDPDTFSLIVESDDQAVGHIAFSPVLMKSNPSCRGYILAPLGIRPEWQKKGLGTKLVESGKNRLVMREVNVLFVYGDPAYYGKFGFSADNAAGFSPPYELQYSFGWQAVFLGDNTGIKLPTTVSCVPSLSDPVLW